MKKIIASIIVCGFAVAMVACGGKKTEQAAETTDSTAAKTDSAAAKIDSAVNTLVDTVKAK
jgi:hypothetical protein